MWTTLETYGRRLLREFPSLMPYLLVAIGLLVVLILARIFVVLWAKKRVSAPEDVEAGGAGTAGRRASAASGIGASFTAAMRRLREFMRKRGYHIDWFVSLMGHRYRYELPWYAVVGEEGSGKTTLLDRLPVDTPVPPVRSDDASDPEGGCNWWFYNQALVLDVPGAYLHRADGQTKDDGWTRTLHELRKHRSRQPLNGIVLTIPCPDLVGPEACSTADIEAKAGRLHNKLRDLQRVLGLRLPVYVVLTKGDEVPGFRAFSTELPAERQDDMLGWSNPYAVDAAYTSDWAEEAIASLHDDLYYAQLQAFSDGVQADDRDALFLFPDRLREATANLKTYLNELFTESAYYEGFMLRGIYLTGDTGGGGEPESNGAADGTSPRPGFLKDLFQTKVFEEWKLARPLASAQSWQQRVTRAVQGGVAVLALLGGIGLWAAADALSDQNRSLTATLEDAKASMAAVSQWRQQPNDTQRAAPEARAFRENASTLLRRSGAAANLDLTSFLIPASWVSSVEGTVDEAIAATYDEVILRSMRSALQRRGDRLVTGGLRSGFEAAAAADSLTLQALPAYQAWSGYVQALARWERAVQRYNGLGQDPNLDHLASLADYLFDVQVRAGLSDAPDVYRAALADVDIDSVRTSAYRASGTEKMRRHAQRFNESLAQRYGVLVRLRQLARQIDQLGTLTVGSGVSGGQEATELRAVREGIAAVGTVLERPQSRWVTSDTLALETVYGSFLAFADTSVVVTPGVEKDLRADGRAAVQSLQARLAEVRSEMTGRLLQTADGRVRRVWTPNVTALREALGTLLDQPFMAPASSGQPLQARVPENRRLQWDTRELQRVVQHIQVYDSVTTQGFAQFSPAMQRTAREVAGAGLSTHLRTHLARAQSFVLDTPTGAFGRREAQVQRRADRLRRALGPLNTALTIQGELNMDVARRRLAQVTAQEAYGLLEDVEGLLTAENLYGVGGAALQQWDGRRSPNQAYVNARDSQQVQRYLDVQRERMMFLGEALAGPALSFLRQWEAQLQITTRPLVAKWRGIRTALREYENKTAGNSLSVYENFVAAEMSDVRPVEYYLQQSRSQIAQQSSDFFLERRNRLRRRLYERSRTLALQRARREYGRLAARFNNQLSGRFPFSTLDTLSVSDAPPSAVRDFYEAYDRYGTAYRAVLSKADAGAQAEAFLQRIGELRPFFSAVLDRPSTYPLPTLDVAPAFRVNRAREQLGDQVIDWRMRAGAEQVRYGQRDTLHWAAGDSVIVRLRWAADAPTQPTAAERGRVRPAAGTVTYRYGGQWALFRLLRRHQPPPRAFPRRVDPNPYTLRFGVQTRGPGPEGARLFVRQRVYRAGTADRITVSPSFPRQAPPFAPTTRTAP